MSDAARPTAGQGELPGRTARPDGTPLVPEGLDATLVLLRHGETEWIREGRFQGSAETPLSALGRRQAALAGERLARPHVSPSLPIPGGLPREIVHSPLGRTVETAEAVRAAIAELGVDAPLPALRPAPGIREIGQGLWEGETMAEIQRRWPAEIGGWRHDPLTMQAPGGERLVEVDERVRPALASVLDELGRDQPRGTTDRPQVSGYHGGGALGAQPWSVLVGHDGVFKVVMLALFDLPLAKFWSFSLGLTGISVVEFRGGRPVLRAFNSTAHLAPIEDELAREEAERRAQTGAL